MQKKKTTTNWRKAVLEEAQCRPQPGSAVSVSSKTASWAATVEKPVAPALAIQYEALLVSEKDAAKMLGVSRRTVFHLNKQGLLTARKIGKRKLYCTSGLKKFAAGEAA